MVQNTHPRPFPGNGYHGSLCAASDMSLPTCLYLDGPRTLLVWPVASPTRLNSGWTSGSRTEWLRPLSSPGGVSLTQRSQEAAEVKR